MITSIHNPKIKSIRTWQTNPHKRKQVQVFVIEGVRLLEEALKSAWQVDLLLYTGDLDQRGQKIVAEYRSQSCQVEQVSDHVMAVISDTQTSQGVLAVLPARHLEPLQQPKLVLLLDEMRDPGNLGTILRTAHASGFQEIWLSPGCVDPFSPKVLRSAMGAHFHLPIKDLSWEEIAGQASLLDLHVFLADVGSGASYTEVDFCQPLLLVIGGEASGASLNARSLANTIVHIPMAQGVESLNAAVAAGILMFEVFRLHQKI